MRVRRMYVHSVRVGRVDAIKVTYWVLYFFSFFIYFALASPRLATPRLDSTRLDCPWLWGRERTHGGTGWTYGTL